MDGSDSLRATLRESAADGQLAALLLETASAGANGLSDAGRSLHVIGHLIGDGRVSGRSTRVNGDDAQVAVGVLTQIAADLLDASASLVFPMLIINTLSGVAGCAASASRTWFGRLEGCVGPRILRSTDCSASIGSLED